MSHAPQQTVVIHETPGTSGLAIAGLIFSILGWFTCGLLCIPGAFLCFLALFSRGPKGTAIAGLIVGFPGTLFFAFVGLGMIMGLLGLGAAASSAVAEAEKARVDHDAEQTSQSLEDVNRGIPELEISTTGESESVEPEGRVDPVAQAMGRSDEPIPVEPSAEEMETAESPAQAELPPSVPTPSESEYRTWTDASGKFQVEAEFVSYAMGLVKLRKRDGAIITLPLEKLSEADQGWVREQFKSRKSGGRREGGTGVSPVPE